MNPSFSASPGRTPRAGLVVGLLFAATFAARLLVLAWGWPERPGIVVNPDTPTYIRPALALLHTGCFSPSVARAPEPELNRTPGYPAIVAAVYAVFGETPLALGVLSALLASASLPLLFLLARTVLSERESIVAVLLLAIDPGTFRYGLVALTETPFTFLLLLGLLSLLAADSGRRGVLLAGAGGALLGAATLVRPLTLYFLPACVVLLPVVLPGWRRPAKLLAFSLPAALLVGGWSLRNELRAGTPVFTLNQSVELYMIRGAYVQAMVDGVSAGDVRDRLGWAEYLYRFGYVESEKDAFGGIRYADAFPVTSKLSLTELARLYDRRGREILLAHPLEALRMTVEGLFFLFLSPPFLNAQFHWGSLVPDGELLRAYFYPRPLAVLDWLRRHEPVTWGLTLLWLPLLAALAFLALLGVLRSLRERPGLLLAATLAYLVLVTAGPSCIDDRYRLPLMPLLCLFAVRGVRRQSARKT